MKRIRWFHATFPHGIDALAGGLEKMPLLSGGHMGFRILRRRQESLEAAYYERFEFTEQNVDPFHNGENVVRVGYRSVFFCVTDRYPELEIQDAPRALSSFFSRFAEATNFGATVKPLDVDVLAWSSSIQQSAALDTSIRAMTLSDLDIEEGVVGRLTVGSRTRDVEASVRRLLVRRSYRVRSVQLLPTQAALRTAITLTSDGVVRCSSGIDTSVLEVIRTTLPNEHH